MQRGGQGAPQVITRIRGVCPQGKRRPLILFVRRYSRFHFLLRPGRRTRYLPIARLSIRHLFPYQVCRMSNPRGLGDDWSVQQVSLHHHCSSPYRICDHTIEVDTQRCFPQGAHHQRCDLRRHINGCLARHEPRRHRLPTVGYDRLFLPSGRRGEAKGRHDMYRSFHCVLTFRIVKQYLPTHRARRRVKREGNKECPKGDFKRRSLFLYDYQCTPFLRNRFLSRQPSEVI